MKRRFYGVGRNSAAYCAERKPQPRSPFGGEMPCHHRAGAVCEMDRARQWVVVSSHAAQYAALLRPTRA